MNRKFNETRIRYYVIDYHGNLTSVAGKKKKVMCGCNSPALVHEVTGGYINTNYAELGADSQGRCKKCGVFIMFKYSKSELKELRDGNPT